MKRLAQYLPGLCSGLVVMCLIVACVAQDTAVPMPPFDTTRQAETAATFPRKITTDLKFEHLGLEEGLSQSSIYGIAQDKQGFMWFGTEDGLNRYDGYDFIVYKPKPNDFNSLADGFIQELYTDRDGLLWIGTNSGGLDRLDPQTMQFTHFVHDPENDNSLSSNDVLAIFQDDTGVFWVGTHGGGLNRLELTPAHDDVPATAQITRFQHDDADPASLSHDMVTAVFQDHTGTLWVGTDGGLDRFNPETATFSHYRHGVDDPNSLSSNQITAVFQDTHENLWVGTELGLNRLLNDAGNGRFGRYLYDPMNPDSISHNQVRVIYEDSRGRLWVGTEEGLNLVNLRTYTFRRYSHDHTDSQSIANDSILSIFEDESGVFWLGYPGGGISMAEPGRDRFTLYRPQNGDPADLSHEVVFGIAEAPDKTIWLGTQHGLNQFDPQSETFTAYFHNPQFPHSLINDTVWAVAAAKNGDIWAGTEGGLSRLNPATGIFNNYQFQPDDPTSLGHNYIWTLYLDRADNLWIGTEAGLSHYLPESNSFENFQYNADDPNSLGGQAVVGIFEDSKGTLWVGTFDGGLNRMDRESGTFTRYQHDPGDPNSLSHNAVMAFYEDENGRLWLGTYGGGLNVFDPQTEQFQHYREADGLPNDVVYAILADELGTYWLSTNKGLSRFNPQTETFQNFNVNDGLQSNEFDLNAYLHSSSGEFYFGGVNGLNRFDPTEIHLNPYLAPVVLTTLTQSGQPVSPEQTALDMSSVNLFWPNNAFEFEMAALNYDRSEKNQYAFMLAGFDDSWNMVGTRRFGRYTNLPGGDYTLYLAAANADGFWHITEQPIHMTVQPPWWQTWWFRGLLPLLVVVVTMGAYWWRLHSIQRQSEELALQVTERTKELSSLYTITAVASSTLNLQETLTTALDTTLDLIACDAGGIHLFHEESAELALVNGCCLSQNTINHLQKLSRNNNFLDRVAKSGKPLVLVDLENLEAVPFHEDGFDWLAVTPLTSHGSVLGTLFMVRRESGSLSPPNSDLLASIGNQIGVAIDNAHLFAAEQSRAEQFQLITEVSHHFTSILEIDDVLAEVVRLIQQTYGYYHVAIGLIEGDEVVYQMGAGKLWEDPDFDFSPSHLKVGEEGLSGWVAGSGEPLIVPDVRQEVRYVEMRGSAARSELTVPLKIKDRVIGVLDVQSDRLDDFDETDLEVMQLLAGQAAIAIENARLYEQAQQLAVVEERNRLARDLHDSVTQSIYSLTLLAEAGQRMIQVGDTAVIQHNQERLSSIAQQALQEMRLLVFELRPLDLRQAGLVSTVEHRLEVVERRAGVDAKFTVADLPELPQDVEEALYRIAHEALNNALKHAQATAVSVTIHSDSDRITLEVYDNGRGFETAVGERLGGLGLVSMRERAEMLNGRLAITSSPEDGTTVCAEIPLRVERETAVLQHTN